MGDFINRTSALLAKFRARPIHARLFIKFKCAMLIRSLTLTKLGARRKKRFLPLVEMTAHCRVGGRGIGGEAAYSPPNHDT